MQPSGLTNSEKPLAGQTIVVTRPLEQAQQLCDLLAQQGANVLVVPMIEVRHCPLTPELQACLSALATFNWVIFTSQNGVHATFSLLAQLGQSTGLQGHPIAAVGQKTARCLAQYGHTATLVSAEANAKGLTQALLEADRSLSSRQHLWCRGNLGKEVLSHGLQQHGIKVTECVVYETTVLTAKTPQWETLLKHLQAGTLNAITFASSSAVEGLYAGLNQSGLDWHAWLQPVRLLPIGPSTHQSLLARFGQSEAYPKEPTNEALLAALSDISLPVYSAQHTKEEVPDACSR